MRGYTSIFVEGNYKIIETAKNRYILDLVKSSGDYATRRISILKDTKAPYTIYPLRVRITSLSQLIASKKRTFIDATGKIVVWKPSTFYTLECFRVSSVWETDTGKLVLSVPKISSKFVIEDWKGEHPSYVQVVKMGKGYVLYSPCREYLKTTRKKV